MANKEGSSKSGNFIAVCTTPDVCMTAVGNTVPELRAMSREQPVV